MDINTDLSFRAGLKPIKPHSPDDLFFVFCKGAMASHGVGSELYTIPLRMHLGEYDEALGKHHYIGEYKGVSCYAVEIENSAPVSSSLQFVGLRELLGYLPDAHFNIAGRASQILSWDRDHSYCGQCAAPMLPYNDERAKICPLCQIPRFPRLSPAIIVAIRDGDKLLLAHNEKFKNGMYSLIAGYVEVGESLEECVHREVFEEVGIDITNVKYALSQSWPFPDSIMVGFTADYQSGEINPDGIEITKADWFSPENFPLIPRQGTISRKLIDSFILSVSPH